MFRETTSLPRQLPKLGILVEEAYPGRAVSRDIMSACVRFPPRESTVMNPTIWRLEARDQKGEHSHIIGYVNRFLV